MATTNLGRIGIVPRGTYNASIQYYMLDAISHQDVSYLVLQNVKGVTPSDDGVNYMVLARSGNIRGTFATAAALDAAFPTGNGYIYAVTENQSWYYWSGTAWVIGGSMNNNTTLANINSQLAENEVLFQQGIASNEALAATMVQEGIESANAASLVKNESVLNESSHTIFPAWEIGYISGSTGAPGGSSPNSNLRTPLLAIKRGTIISNAHTGILHIYQYTSTGVWINKLTYITGVGHYTFLADNYIRLSLEYGTSTSDTSLGNTFVSIVERNYYKSISELTIKAEDAQQAITENAHGLSDIKSQIFDASNATMPLWEFGYINGSTGVEILNYITARTIDIIPLPPGTTLEALDANVTFAIMKYVNGAWNSLLENLTTADGVYRINTLTYVRINYSYSGNPTITDLTLPNTKIRIIRPTFSIQAFSNNYWNSKKIVWFGTSIPEGTATIYGASHSYPSLIGQMLGATVYNESLGSSCARAGSHADITVSDPMGYAGMFWNVLLKSLSLSSTEKQAIFDNWATWQPLLKGTGPASIGAEDQTLYKSYSWDVKLAKYLTGGSVGNVDLYVFDHGHNDSINYNYNDASEMGLIPTTANDRTYFIGAMNFLIDKILSNSPKSRILFIGHYENARKAGISLSQEILADIWDFPLIKTWQKLGWSQKSITSGGTTKTITQWWMLDDLHPHSDTTGEAIIKYAEILYPEIRDAR